MKKTSVLLFLLSFTFSISAQEISTTKSGESIYENNADNPCITSHQYELIEKRCAENIKLINKQNILQKKAAVLNWPLKAKLGFNDCSFYYTTAYVDHDNSSTFKDYNCGTNTYNGHKGTDIAIGPFPFYKLDNGHVEVIAAAAGTIIDKHDGEYDRNCVGVGSSLPANYVVLQHADGSRTLYWHMKKNSITTKAINQTVTVGEYLGAVGSSGSSGGPHLHFEVWSGSTSSTVVDPFAGTCNGLNSTSWWAAQKPYTEPSVIKASVHTTDIVMPACPATETPNESNSYAIPFQGAGLAPGYAKFYTFFRNASNGTSADMKILNPDATVFNSWTQSFTATSRFSYYGFSKKLPVTAGTYTFQATYNGITCSQTFTVTTATSLKKQEALSGIKIYPNPSNGKFIVDVENLEPQTEIEVYNIIGEKIYQSEIHISKSEILITEPKGVYFYHIKNNQQVISTGKLIVQL